MGRIIINNNSSLDDLAVIGRVKTVIRKGRISDDGKCYCYHVGFVDDIHVFASTTRTGSDVFTVIEDKEE